MEIIILVLHERKIYPVPWEKCSGPGSNVSNVLECDLTRISMCFSQALETAGWEKYA